jgi:hypothetical protein
VCACVILPHGPSVSCRNTVIVTPQAIKDILDIFGAGICEEMETFFRSRLLIIVTTAIFRVTLTRKLFQLSPYSCVFVARIVFTPLAVTNIPTVFP